ncbi:MAG: AraC family transcriptional regulator [Planctomycetota bacterium]
MNQPSSTSQPRIIGAGHVGPDPRWAVRAHSHTFHEIIAPVRGRMHVAIRGGIVTAGAGEVLVYQAGTVHDEKSDAQDPVDMYFVAFEHPDFAAPLPVKVRDGRARVPLLISWLLAERPGSSPLQESVALRLVDAVVAETRRAAAERPEPEMVVKARALMRARLAEPLTLEDLAREAGMSRFHFLRKFRAATGRTPMDELRLLRLEAARSLILTTGLPLKTVAPMAGLGDEYHLSRLFRKHFGFPPGALRRHAPARP